MLAAIHKQYGPPEVVQIKNVPKPKPKDNQLLIKVHSSSVNRTDCGFRSASYFVSRFFSGLFRPKYKTLGSEFAGEIVQVGSSVSTYKIGDRIFGFNDSRFGGHAQYMILNEKDAFAKIPEGMDYGSAAALSEGAHYALYDIRAAKIGKGTKVLINGATGAIGSAAVQLCRNLEADITAVCREEHFELVRSLGAKKTIDYKTQDFTTLLEPSTFDFVFDAVGKSSFGKCKPLLKPKGVYISTELGKNGQNVFLALLKPFIGSRKVLFPIPLLRREDIILIKELAEKGEFKPVIDRIYPLEQIVDAYRYVERGQKIGNVLISIPPND